MKTLREFRTLHRIVDDIFAESEKMGFNWTKLATRSGLGRNTVYKLGNYTTMYPRSQTVFMLAQAVGMQITIEKKTGKLKAAG